MKNHFTWQNWILVFSITVMIGILGSGIMMFLEFSKNVRRLGRTKELQFYAFEGKADQIEPLLKFTTVHIFRDLKRY